jgi:hypothetical protein
MAAKPTTKADVKFRGKVLVKEAKRPGTLLWPLFAIIGLPAFGAGLSMWSSAHNTTGFSARSTLGIGMALVSMAFAFVAMLYPLRKRTYLLPIGQLEPWCITHVFAGLISFAFILIHADFGLGAWVSAALMITFGSIVLSGLYGYFVINERNPRVLNRLEVGDENKQNVRLLEDLADGIEAAEKEIADIQKSGGDGIKTFVDQVLKIANTKTSKGVLYGKNFNLNEHIMNLREATQTVTSKLAPKEAAELERLAVAQAKLNSLKAQFSLQFELRAWLSFHIVSTALMLTLLFAHVFTAVFVY